MVESAGVAPGLYGIGRDSGHLFGASRRRVRGRFVAQDPKANHARAFGGTSSHGRVVRCEPLRIRESIVIHRRPLGALGGLTGAFAGFEIRKRLVAAWNIRDVFVALTEDLIAIGLACFLVTR